MGTISPEGEHVIACRFQSKRAQRYVRSQPFPGAFRLKAELNDGLAAGLGNIDEACYVDTPDWRIKLTEAGSGQPWAFKSYWHLPCNIPVVILRAKYTGGRRDGLL